MSQMMILNADHSQIASILANLRVSQNISQKELAESTGLAQQAISRIESGTYAPSLKNLLLIAGALGYDVVLEKNSAKPQEGPTEPI